jgi:hypothetical protein
MRIKKKDLLESKFVVDPEDYDKIEDEVEDDDIVHFVDETTEETPAKDPMDAIYVAYDGEYSDETPFEINGEKYQYCWATYPNGKRDIAVYAFRGDVTYGYTYFRKTVLNINESVKPIISKGELMKFIKENKK